MAACVSSLDLLCNLRPGRSINSSDPSTAIPLFSATVNCRVGRSIAACKLRSVLAKSGVSSGGEKFEEDEGSFIDEDPARKKVASIIAKFQNGAFANIPFVPGFSLSFSSTVGDRTKEVEGQDDLIHKQKQVISINPKFRKRRRAFPHIPYRHGHSILYCDLVRECLKDFVEVEENDDTFIDDYSTSASSIHKQSEVQERDFVGTPYIPIYVNLPLGTINMECELVNADDLKNQLRVLKSINVDGVKVNCWWGIVEAHAPQQYNWGGYKKLFEIVRDLKLKLQVVMSFHECGGDVDDVCISLPQWVIEVGNENPDIFFTDREGRRNHECLTWGIDEECVLGGRTAIEVYFDYMKSFRAEFDEFFEDGVICEIEIGLGPCGELRYPSFPAKHGWKYPGIGEFQCYDKYMIKNLEKAAKERFCPWITGPDSPCAPYEHDYSFGENKRPLSFWGTPPDSAGSYNSNPHETRFFCDGGGFYSYYARFFLSWYSQFLVDHGDRVLTMANIALKGTPLVAKLPCIYWWYMTGSHAAEVTAGIYNFAEINGYLPIAMMLKINETALNLTCIELRTSDQLKDFPEAFADPEKLVRKVLNAAWGVGIRAAGENVRPCYNREGYNTILENAKPLDRPDGRHISSFTYHRLSPELMQDNFTEFERFVKRMHGESVPDLGSGDKEEAQTLD